jgi:hypothetical protein
MDTKQFILLLPLVVVGIAAAISLVSFRHHYPKPFKVLSVLWVINFFIDLAGHIAVYFKIGNHWLYNIYFWILYLTIPWIYNTQIQNKYVRSSIRIFHIVFPLLIVAASIAFGIMNLQTIIVVAGDLFMIFIMVAYFRQLYLSEETAPLTRDPWFWFSFGFLVHFGGTVPFLGMLNYLWHHYPLFTNFYYLYISNSFTILLNLLIIAGFLCRRNYQK